MKKILYITFLLILTSCTKTSRVPFSGSGGIQGSQSPTSFGGTGGLIGSSGTGGAILPQGSGGFSGSGGLSGGFTLHPAPPCPHGQICDPTYHSESTEDRKFSF